MKNTVFSIRRLLVLTGYAAAGVFAVFLLLSLAEWWLYRMDALRGVAQQVLSITSITGVVYPNETPYMKSAFSKPFRGRFGRNGQNLRLRSILNAETGTFRISATVSGHKGGRGLITCQDQREWTCSILASATAGTRWWLGWVKTLDGDWIVYRNRAQVGSRLLDRPSTQGELSTYQDWLVSIIGSRDLFVDGWRRPIKLTLDVKVSPPVLIASSAGPDGKWGDRKSVV